MSYSILQLVRIARNADRCNSQSNSVCLSVCLSVRPSVTFRCFVQTNEDRASGRQIILVSGEVKFIRIFAGDHPPAKALKLSTPIVSENLTNNRP